MSNGKYIDFDFDTDDTASQDAEPVAKPIKTAPIRIHTCKRLYRCPQAYINKDDTEWCKIADESIWGDMFFVTGRCPIGTWFINKTPFE